MRFTLVPGHDDPSIESVVDRYERFWVIQKLPLDGIPEIVEEG